VYFAAVAGSVLIETRGEGGIYNIVCAGFTFVGMYMQESNSRNPT